MGKFRLSNGPRIRKQQSFDPEKIFVVKCGQKINMYDSIQEASEDTDIYKTLEKYGSIEPLMRPNLKAIEEDFEDYETLITLHDKMEKAQEMWNKLDAGVKAQFHNNREEFVEKGQEWVQSLIKQSTKKTMEKPVEKHVEKQEENK